MPECLVNGVRLHYEEHGQRQEGRAPILCIHGMSSSGLVWGPSVAKVAALGRTIVYDRRGCTRSERPEPYTTSIAQQADDAAALLRALDASPAVVIGRSYGGEVALALALRHPETVRALVLLEAGLVNLVPEAKAWADGVLARVLAAAEREPSDAAKALVHEILGEGGWEKLPAPLQSMFTGNSPAVVAEMRGGFLEAEPEELAKLGIPVLLVASAESPPAFRQVVAAMGAAIPNARTALVPGGHLIDLAEPAVLELVATAIQGTSTQAPNR
ncbi:alpha/beta hydrolase [Pendulispora brunnea]|uniref:Alpha/beta hydrolase n=1 Tax=Pendulispora brunnea TaxID=2905690 RepID=A0ABZ2KL94_9BACT